MYFANDWVCPDTDTFLLTMTGVLVQVLVARVLQPGSEGSSSTVMMGGGAWTLTGRGTPMMTPGEGRLGSVELLVTEGADVVFSPRRLALLLRISSIISFSRKGKSSWIVPPRMPGDSVVVVDVGVSNSCFICLALDENISLRFLNKSSSVEDVIFFIIAVVRSSRICPSEKSSL